MFEVHYIPAYIVELTFTEMRALSMKTISIEMYNKHFMKLAEYASIDHAITWSNNIYNIYVKKLNSKIRDRILNYTL